MGIVLSKSPEEINDDINSPHSRELKTLLYRYMKQKFNSYLFSNHPTTV